LDAPPAAGPEGDGSGEGVTLGSVLDGATLGVTGGGPAVGPAGVAPGLGIVAEGPGVGNVLGDDEAPLEGAEDGTDTGEVGPGVTGSAALPSPSPEAHPHRAKLVGNTANETQEIRETRCGRCMFEAG
jgi:hypothetical protein